MAEELLRYLKKQGWKIGCSTSITDQCSNTGTACVMQESGKFGSETSKYALKNIAGKASDIHKEEKNETDPKNDSALPGEITDRYVNIPSQWYDFISGLNVLMNEEETIWFLCFKDFYEQDEDAFQWNEWERISLESAADDEEWKKEIKAFWDRHFPIILSVRDGYSYYAISMENGAVVCGFEPEFEECEMVADSFEEFMEKIVSGKIEL